MKHIRRIIAMLMCLFMLPAFAQAEAGLPLQDAHRVSLAQTETRQKNGSSVHLWHIETAHVDVTDELNTLAQAWAAELGPTLKAPGSSNSRLYVSIRPSRTGLTWQSYMLQARTVYHEKTAGVRFTTRTYDMATGDAITLEDVFPAESEAWGMLAEAVRNGVNAYFPDMTADAEALDAACARQAVETMDFTLHGMSLVLHLHAADFYPGKEQLIEVTLYYPDIRPFMTEKAQAETDNLTYYKTAALTYDDGPNGMISTRMMDVLLKTGVRATFFLVGERIRQQHFVVQREHDEGHAIATHNFEHVYANSTPASRLTPMPAKVNKATVDAIGIPVRYARAPGGQWEGMARAEMGWPLIQWSVEAQDWQGEYGPSPKQTATNIIAGMTDGGIILMHDLKFNSIEASELFIPQLQEEGYLFLTVDELFAKDGVALLPDTPYWRCENGATAK